MKIHVCAAASKCNIGQLSEKYTRTKKCRECHRKKNVKCFIFLKAIFATRGSQSQYVYFPRFAKTNVIKNFLFCLIDVRREFLKIYAQTLYETPSEGISKTRILSQFCKRIAKLRTMKHDRLTDFFPQNFCPNRRQLAGYSQVFYISSYLKKKL